jgi:hypothetical protein
MNHLIDVTLFLIGFAVFKISLLKMQIVLLAVIMIGGIAIQSYNGF